MFTKIVKVKIKIHYLKLKSQLTSLRIKLFTIVIIV